MLGGRGVPGKGGQRGKYWDNCNSIINKIYIKKEREKKKEMDVLGTQVDLAVVM